MNNKDKQIQQADQMIQKSFQTNESENTEERLKQLIDAFRADFRAHPYVEKMERAHKPAKFRSLILSWPMKLAASIALTVAVGAVAATVGLKIYRYHFEGKDRVGRYLFRSEPELIYAAPADANGLTSSASSSVSLSIIIMDDATNGIVNPSEAGKVERMQQDLAEIDQLRQLDERELTRVRDMWVNGHFHRTLSFRYTLADGRIHNVNEGDTDIEKLPTPEQCKRAMAEIARLREQNQRELIRIIESDIGGNVFRTCAYEYTLSDGRTEIVGEPDPDPDVRTPVLSLEQQKEVWHLRRLKEGEYLGILDREINGHIFSCETYIFTLEDGPVVTHAVGERKDRKINLTDADREELRSLQEQGAGELLDITEREVREQMFRFERRRYVLSDGTEVVRSVGKPNQ